MQFTYSLKLYFIVQNVKSEEEILNSINVTISKEKEMKFVEILEYEWLRGYYILIVKFSKYVFELNNLCTLKIFSRFF